MSTTESIMLQCVAESSKPCIAQTLKTIKMKELAQKQALV